ncbi:MAG: hypothetical protein A3C15_00705 [Candidatus Magasanikbacteria bacterium RIFCSPHIGHO2_02_FULL_50_9b]|uniref:Uncharacterized protein n=1 Tax=Candidatus Magasanikbacteria bacterium RIFCSPHIGHO2_02_FULL_50_9b TaxID=1798682 RepID=A0A1F6M8K9_9BACT|nr:MAG: hypothetical protein A3C15_00705 [Candidatus Magasanikbacteria bacterium RIFCSPHIGHO2_02_FULL_50_9b]
MTAEERVQIQEMLARALAVQPHVLAEQLRSEFIRLEWKLNSIDGRLCTLEVQQQLFAHDHGQYVQPLPRPLLRFGLRGFRER